MEPSGSITGPWQRIFDRPYTTTMTSSWISGIPVRSRTIVWSSTSEWTSINTGDPWREGTSLLDGILLYWFPPAGNDSHTVTFLADTTRQEGEEPVVISKAAELDYVVHKAVLVGKSEYATAEWIGRCVIARHYK